MAKLNKEEQWRREGMSYALKIAREKGIDELEKELKIRNATQLPLKVSVKAMEECVNNIKNQTIDTVIILMAATLHDEFGFGEKRVQRAIDRFDLKAECLSDGYCTWQDQIDIIKEEIGIELGIRYNNSDVKYDK